MANETLSIQKDDARLTVIGKSKADVYIDSGLGIDLGDLDIGSLDPFDLNWQTDVPNPDNLPDTIQIITPPTKNTYTKGQKIDLSGAIVGAYKNGSIWTSTKYPNGHIPLGELYLFPFFITEEYVPKKESTFGTFVYTSVGLGETFIRTNDVPTTHEKSNQLTISSGDGPFYAWSLTNYGTVVGPVYCSPNPFTVFRRYEGKNGSVTERTESASLQNVLGKRYYSDQLTNGGYQDRMSPIYPTNEALVERVNYTILYGETAQTLQNIYVSWERPSDKMLLQTSFSVVVTASGGNGGR